ncbi:MAG TPA: DUF1538 domain-containing protein [Rhodospirillales bacterium]|nr:DUF1538 domain-containing protein [Rhodospirillales bacterium]
MRASADLAKSSGAPAKTAFRMDSIARGLLRRLVLAARDLAPIVVVVVLFQTLLFRQPLPDLDGILLGVVFVVLGLALFVYGLEMGLFPLGEALADAFARKGSLAVLLTFAFGLGFATTVAEPALNAVAAKAATAASGAGVIAGTGEAKAAYALALRLTVAVSVGAALVVGMVRIIKGWPIQYFIIGGYALVMAMTAFAPPEIVGIAYDSGGVTTSTITVPLVTALGVGLASAIRGRNPMIDGFGLIALASLAPMIFVLVFGMVV